MGRGTSPLWRVRAWLEQLPLRLLLFVATPLLVSQLLIAWGVLALLERRIEERMQEDVELIARALQRPVGDALVEGNPQKVLSILKASFDFRRVYSATIFDHHGEILAASGVPDSRRRLPGYDLPVKGGGQYESVLDEEVYSYYVPIWVNGVGQQGLLRIARKKSEIDAFVHALRTRVGAIVLFGAIVTMVIVFTGHYVAIGRSLRQLQGTIQRIRQGHSFHRAMPAGPKEVQDIIVSFNRMMSSIERAQDVLVSEREARVLLVQRVLRMEKLAAIGRIAGGIAHELGSPLGTFSGRFERVLRSDDLSERARKELLKLDREVKHMTRIVSEVLDFARTDQPNKRPVDLRHIFHAAEETFLMSRRTPEQVLMLEHPDESVHVMADNSGLERVMSNLIRNAVAAISDTGTVWVSANKRPVSTQRAEEQRASAVEISVCDDGAGIAKEVQRSLFEPFVTTRHGKGTGLGLPIAQSIVEHHGGQIVAHPRQGGGSCFSFELELASRLTVPSSKTTKQEDAAK